MSLDTSAAWSVVQTESQREPIAAEFLKREGFDIYLPKIRIRSNGRARICALFPSYLFGRIGCYWSRARWTIGVLGILMQDDEIPAQLPDKIIDEIKKREGPDGLVRLPKQANPNALKRGQAVRILRGPFEGRNGLYDGMVAHERERVLLDLLGRFTPLELPRRDIVALSA